MRDRDIPDLAEIFPKLSASHWEKRSDPEKHYNCLAWAFGSNNEWWESLRYQGYYWPTGIPREDTVDNWVKIAEIHGFELCADAELEIGFEKLAIYVDRFGDPGHIVRSADDGGWLSKLGKLEDIWHDSLEAIECEAYGTASIFLKKSRLG